MPALKSRAKAVVSFKASPHRLALAFGLGIALGIIPGTGAIVAAGAAAAFKLNLPLMVAGALLTNPLTVPLVYAGSFFLGHWLLGDWLPAGRISRLLLGTLTGNLLLAVGMGLAGYLIVLGISSLLKRK